MHIGLVSLYSTHSYERIIYLRNKTIHLADKFPCTPM